MCTYMSVYYFVCTGICRLHHTATNGDDKRFFVGGGGGGVHMSPVLATDLTPVEWISLSRVRVCDIHVLHVLS